MPWLAGWLLHVLVQNVGTYFHVSGFTGGLLKSGLRARLVTGPALAAMVTALLLQL